MMAVVHGLLGAVGLFFGFVGYSTMLNKAYQTSAQAWCMASIFLSTSVILYSLEGVL